MIKRTAASLIIALTCVCGASAHPGGIDRNGGHNDRKNGGYHFHSGPLDGRSFDSREEALRALRAEGVSPAESANRDGGTRKSKGKKPSESAQQSAEHQKPGDADYQRGMKHMAEGDYEAAEDAFKKAAEQGHEGARKALEEL